MSLKAHGQVRRGQVISTYGPGALIDLPRHSAIVGGLDGWPPVEKLEEVIGPRLSRKLQAMTAMEAPPRLYAPPADDGGPQAEALGIRAWRFPEWFVVQEKDGHDGGDRARRLVHRKALDAKGRFDGLPVVATRFVRACPKGHVDDLDWRYFVHRGDGTCRVRQLWLDERGTSGDLGDLSVRCECGKARSLDDAALVELRALGTCSGMRPWLGQNSAEPCTQPSRLLTRTASNAYFSQVVSVLSLPQLEHAAQAAVRRVWDDLQIVDTAAELAMMMKKPAVAAALSGLDGVEVLAAIQAVKAGRVEEKPVKQVELEALLAAREGYGDDVPVDLDFHARRLPEHAWRRGPLGENIAAVVQLHRLREVLALVGFTRFEAVTPDIHGEYETDVERAEIALDPHWYPAVENRGEGVFLQLRAEAVSRWLERPAVKERLDALEAGHRHWLADHHSQRPFPGGPYVLLHTLSHLLLQSLAMRCGYPASSLRERVYVNTEHGHYGILLYTGSPDADGTLGGLVQQARHIEEHLAQALRMGMLCSSDPVCAHHAPGESLERRWLHGAACHGCVLVAEPSCEMRNDYLDRALVVPVIGVAPQTAFFEPAQ